MGRPHRTSPKEFSSSIYDIMKLMKTIIVAFDQNYGIGANNDLLWQRNLPADLQHFKEATLGNAIIMGYNTYKSIGRPLSDRQNIVISDDGKPIDGFEVADSLQSAFDLVPADKEIFVIGGGQVYASAIDSVDRIMATEVHADFNQATVFFSKIDPTKWREISREKHLADDRNLYDFDFVTYVRIN